jgi:hypothetical protein
MVFGRAKRCRSSRLYQRHETVDRLAKVDRRFVQVHFGHIVEEPHARSAPATAAIRFGELTRCNGCAPRRSGLPAVSRPPVLPLERMRIGPTIWIRAIAAATCARSSGRPTLPLRQSQPSTGRSFGTEEREIPTRACCVAASSSTPSSINKMGQRYANELRAGRTGIERRVWTPPRLQAPCSVASSYDCLRVFGLVVDAVYVGIGP